LKIVCGTPCSPVHQRPTWESSKLAGWQSANGRESTPITRP
jgi:hypothetical protein